MYEDESKGLRVQDPRRLYFCAGQDRGFLPGRQGKGYETTPEDLIECKTNIRV